MPKKRDYIPADNAGFFNWQENLVDTFTPNRVAWGIAAGDFTPITTRQGQYEPLYNKIKNKQNSTTADRVAHDEKRKQYEKELRDFVGRFLAKNPAVTDEDRAILNITIPDTTKTPRPAIDTVPSVKASPKAGAVIEVVHRVDKDSSRPSLHTAADGVEVRYTIVTKGDILPPVDPEDFPKTIISRKAQLLIKVGVMNAGSKLYGYSRWINTSDAGKSSGWSQLYNVVITD